MEFNDGELLASVDDLPFASSPAFIPTIVLVCLLSRSSLASSDFKKRLSTQLHLIHTANLPHAHVLALCIDDCDVPRELTALPQLTYANESSSISLAEMLASFKTAAQPDKAAVTFNSVSGGVDISANDIEVGRDVVGRDKIEDNRTAFFVQIVTRTAHPDDSNEGAQVSRSAPSIPVVKRQPDWKRDFGAGIASISIPNETDDCIIGTLDKTVIGLDARGNQKWTAIVGNQAWRVATDSSGHIIVVGTGSTRPWDISGRGLYCFDANGARKWQIDLKASIWSLAVSPNGHTIVAGTDAKQIVFFDAEGNQLWQETLPGVWWNAWVWSVALSGDGQIGAVGSADKRLRLFQRTGNLIAEMPTHGEVFTVDVSSYGDVIVAGDNAGFVYWLTGDGQLQWEQKLTDKVWSIALSPDSTQVYVGAGSREAHIRVFNRNGESIWKRYVGGSVSHLSVCRRGHRIVAGTYNGDVFIWKEDGTPLCQIKANKVIRRVAVSADGEKVVAVSEDGCAYGVRFHDTYTV